MTSWASPAEGSNTAATPGMKLGDRYQLVEPIASGGMAQVWSANDIVLNRLVAAKVLHPHLATDDAFIERFRREAVAAASLSHSSIVSVYDTISMNGLEAIVMELIDGRTLRAVLDDVGAMPATDVVHLGVQIASALQEAHSAGIVHRDIKPANIMVCEDRRVLVTDFGIAKAGSDADLTATGTLLGTAKYLAPEQVEGGRVDPRSDLYALGVVLFEALTGNPPFKANTDAATALARLHQDAPPVRSLRPNVSPELEAVVAKLMARNPDHRYPRADALRDALLGITSATAAPGEPVPSQSAVARSPIEQWSPPAMQSGPPSATGDVPGGNHVRPPDPPPNLRQGPPAVIPGPVENLRENEFEVLGIDPARANSSTLSEGRVVRTGRSRVVPLLVIALAVAGLLVAGVLLTDVEAMMGLGGDDTANPFDESSPGLAIAGVTSFDPQTQDEDKLEREELTGLAVDGDLETAWTTESYRLRELSGLKDGVGLQIELAERLPLNQIVLETKTEDWVAEIYVGDSFDDDGGNWGEPAAVVDPGSNRAVRELGRSEGKIVLIWIRDTGVSGQRNRFELAEVVIR